MGRVGVAEEVEGSQGKPQAKEGDEIKRTTVDELMQDHVDFLATCLKECMLTNSKLLRVSDTILTAFAWRILTGIS